jgi:hypothetical protein
MCFEDAMLFLWVPRLERYVQLRRPRAVWEKSVELVNRSWSIAAVQLRRLRAVWEKPRELGGMTITFAMAVAIESIRMCLDRTRDHFRRTGRLPADDNPKDLESYLIELLKAVEQQLQAKSSTEATRAVSRRLRLLLRRMTWRTTR